MPIKYTEGKPGFKKKMCYLKLIKELCGDQGTGGFHEKGLGDVVSAVCVQRDR